MANNRMTREDRKVLEILEKVDSLVLAPADQEWVNGIVYLSGYSMPYFVALLETRPQEDLTKFRKEDWALWLSVAKAATRLPLQRLALRAERGPRWEQPLPLNALEKANWDLMNARDFVDRIIWRDREMAEEARRKKNAQARARRASKSR